MKCWQKFQRRLVRLLGSDVDVVRRVEQLDQRQREIGHKLRNIEMRIEPLARLVEGMREEGSDANGVDSIH